MSANGKPLWACTFCGTVRVSLDDEPPVSCAGRDCQGLTRSFVLIPMSAIATAPRPAPPPAGCPTAEELWLAYVGNNTASLSMTSETQQECVARQVALIRSRWPRVPMLDERELAKLIRCDWLACGHSSNEQTTRLAGAAAHTAIAYFNEKMGQGGKQPRECSPPSASCASELSEQSADAPPAPANEDMVRRAAFLGKPPAPTYSERRAALVQECKEVCEQCRLHPWRHMDTDNLAWAWHTDSPGRDFCEARHVSPCLRTRREIAALDAAQKRLSEHPIAVAVDRAKQDDPPAPDESLKEEIGAIRVVRRNVFGNPPRALGLDELFRLENEALAREVRRRIAEELERIVMEPCDSHTSKLYARIAALRRTETTKGTEHAGHGP